MNHDIFIRSYAKDFPWLKYCLKSIAQKCKCFRDVVLVVPESDRKELEGLNLTREKVFYEPDIKGEGYLTQQICKVNADQYTDADIIYFVDSDCCFSRENRPADYFTDRKPVMLITPYAELGAAVPWKPITEKVLKIECPYETMRRLPFVFKGNLLAPFRKYVAAVQGKSIEAYILEQPGRAFSEFNALGAWAHHFHTEEFFWWDTSTTPNLPQPTVAQHWSWGGITKAIQEDLEKMTA